MQRVLVDTFFKERQDPVYLSIDAQDSESGIDEHPLDLFTAKDLQIKDGVDDDGESAVKIDKRYRRRPIGIGDQKT